MSDLFPDEEMASESPRLKWMQQYSISIIDNGPEFKPGDECAETGYTLYRYCCHQRDDDPKLFDDRITGFGDTEDEAITQWALKNDVRLWNEPAPSAKQGD